eukprot:4720404-Prymnesium_polylepis.1
MSSGVQGSTSAICSSYGLGGVKGAAPYALLLWRSVLLNGHSAQLESTAATCRRLPLFRLLQQLHDILADCAAVCRPG